MKMSIGIGLAVALLAGPGPLLAQAGPQGRGMGPGPMMAQRSPVDRVLEQREALGLTEEQTARLEAIAKQVEERNRPHIEKLRESMGDAPMARGRMRDMTPQEREAMRARREAMRPVMAEIQANNRKAMQEVDEVLSAEQREQLRALMRERMERRPRPGAARPGRRG